MKIKFEKIFIIAIILIAVILRFWRLGTYPALNADEAAIGYNAYSLIQTGKDEHANSWPVHFQSFNDFKPGLYFYMILPFVKLMGLNVLSVRLPGALVGVLSVYVLYILLKQYDTKAQTSHLLQLKYVAPMLLAVNPWHIHFSRGGWEVNSATFFILLGIFMFVRYLKTLKNKDLVFSWTLFIASMYTYHSARIVSPLIALSLMLVYRKVFFGNMMSFVRSGFVALILLIPLGMSVLGGGVFSRLSGVGLFSDNGPLLRVNEQRGQHQDLARFMPKLLHNKYVNYSLAFANNYFKHFHGEFLFLSGDQIQRNKVPETGQMYTIELVTILIGIFFIIRKWQKNNLQNDLWKILLIWILIAPIPAALTFQSPHALRAQSMTIPLTTISAYGLVEFLKAISKYSLVFRSVFYAGVLFMFFVSVLRYLHMYYVHMAKEYPFSSQYGIEELVSYISDYSGQKQQIIVTTEYDQPYILLLFYLKYPPEKFQSDHVLTEIDSYGFSTVERFSNYLFKKIDWDEDKINFRNGLIIGTPNEIPIEANIVERVYGANGHEYFVAVAN